MLPYAYNQLRQAALNYQLNAAAAHAAGPPTMDPRSFQAPGPHPYATLGPYPFDPLLAYRSGFGPQRFLHEEPKPQHSYIGLIGMAILSNPDQKMVLSDIYQWILDNYPYFRTRGPGWRNSIRHNLSLNDCFIKSGRSANGKGHYWAVHPANVEDFKKGDFRRRRAQRKVRKHMGLTVADDDEDSDDSPCQSPTTIANGAITVPAPMLPPSFMKPELASPTLQAPLDGSQVSPESNSSGSPTTRTRKRAAFDVESLLAPDTKRAAPSPRAKAPISSGPALQLSPTAAAKASMLWPLGLGFGGLGQFLPPSTAVELPRSPSPNAAAQWQETFAKIMARSYQSRHLSAAGMLGVQKVEPSPVQAEGNGEAQ